MTAYLGPLGMLVPISGSSTLKTTTDRPMSTRVTLGGVRKAQLGRGAHREWGVTVDTALPSESAPLEVFLRGGFGPGPFWWVSEQAVYSNMLPPRVAGLEQPWQDTVHGGPVRLPDGSVAGRSLVITQSATTYLAAASGEPLRLPVMPGVPVTVSAWLSSTGQAFRIDCRDAADQTLAESEQGRTSMDGLSRAAATMVPPPGAHHALVRFAGLGRIVRPAVTWTDGTRDYGAGVGCAAAILTKHDMTALHRLPGPVYLDSSYTILEVGS